jgi:hypothetical protein
LAPLEIDRSLRITATGTGFNSWRLSKLAVKTFLRRAESDWLVAAQAPLSFFALLLITATKFRSHDFSL